MNPSATQVKRRRNEGNCVSQDDGQVTGRRRGRPPYKVSIESLTGADWNYLLGLYLADGNRNRQYEVKFCLQGDEGDIAGRVAELLRRIGLSPHIAFGGSGKADIIVRAYSTRLVEHLPDKKNLSDAKTREREREILRKVQAIHGRKRNAILGRSLRRRWVLPSHLAKEIWNKRRNR